MQKLRVHQRSSVCLFSPFSKVGAREARYGTVLYRLMSVVCGFTGNYSASLHWSAGGGMMTTAAARCTPFATCLKQRKWSSDAHAPQDLRRTFVASGAYVPGATKRGNS